MSLRYYNFQCRILKRNTPSRAQIYIQAPHILQVHTPAHIRQALVVTVQAQQPILSKCKFKYNLEIHMDEYSTMECC